MQLMVQLDLDFFKNLILQQQQEIFDEFKKSLATSSIGTIY